MYEQIKEQIRSAVFGRRLSPGDSIPSQRELARDLQVSLITVTRAYNDLVAEGVIGAQQGKGTVVLAVAPEQIRAHVETALELALREATRNARLGDLSLSDLTQRLSQLWDEEQA